MFHLRCFRNVKCFSHVRTKKKIYIFLLYKFGINLLQINDNDNVLLLFSDTVNIKTTNVQVLLLQ